MLSLPAVRRRALDRIEQTLLAEDPALGLRFAVFARLTLNEAMPGTERVEDRLQRFLRAAVIPPLLVISLLGLLAAAWLMPSGKQACAAGQNAPVRSIHSLSGAAGCRLAMRDSSRPPGAGNQPFSP